MTTQREALLSSSPQMGRQHFTHDHFFFFFFLTITVIDEIVSSPNPYVEVLNLSVTAFGDRVSKEVIKVK